MWPLKKVKNNFHSQNDMWPLGGNLSDESMTYGNSRRWKILFIPRVSYGHSRRWKILFILKVACGH